MRPTITNQKKKRVVTKRGGSLTITIPRQIAKDLDIYEGDYLDIYVKGDEIIMTKSKWSDEDGGPA